MGKAEDLTATQQRNIGERAGRPFAELVAEIRGSGMAKHGEMIRWIKANWGLGHGDANLIAHRARAAESPAPSGDPTDGWYAGKKAALRPIHDAVMAQLATLGDDVEHAPKKTYVSLRRRKQFAMVGPATRTQVEIGFNLKGIDGDDRVQALGPGKMCTHRIRVSSVDEVDAHVADWLKRAYNAAG